MKNEEKKGSRKGRRRPNKLSEDIRPERPPTKLDWDGAFEIFYRELKLKNVSDGTVTYYKNELKMMRRYLYNGIKEDGGDPEDVASITVEDIETHIIEYMMDNGSKETSINTRLRAVRAFFNLLAKKNYINESPTEDLKLIREKKYSIQSFSSEQVRRILAVPDKNTFTGFRDFVIMALMIDTGIRVKEIVGIMTYHVFLDEGYLRIAHPKAYKERNVPLQKDMKTLLRQWLRVRGMTDRTDALFTTVEDDRLSSITIQARIRDIGKVSGVKNVRISPHTFRHTFAKMAVQNGANMFELQIILGHTSLEMVRRYVNLYSTEVASSHKKFSPLNKLFD